MRLVGSRQVLAAAVIEYLRVQQTTFSVRWNQRELEGRCQIDWRPLSDSSSSRAPAAIDRTVIASAQPVRKAEPSMSQESAPLVGVIMGSKSDWEVMHHTHATLTQFGIPHECRVVSAHRTPDWMRQYAQEAEKRGLAVIIAGAGGAAHLPGMVSAHTTLPVLGVPVTSAALNGIDSLLSIVQMPGGVPVGTLAIGKAGAINAALLAVRILAIERPLYRVQLQAFQEEQTQRVLGEHLP